ncbi:Cu(I)-responsive transcriptional regulator [Primorskyibacter flagellatus]|uniref:HTH-type transcriptional regulator CueR n=1 Tax=Primorskyibacter flagellatus TaxID=1387277 RepID=A0A917EEY8_9RHOB|nr:MerR family transcriptional regulator [Primorskyibacter flagellatus]GGE25530.1 Cu(I)-responsive transcriptional regulator [Primorskyibacter flagellatus]
MNIGHAAGLTGLPVKTIRYYEEIGLVTADRAANGYRDFGDRQITQLRLLAQARHLGFGLDECRRLLDLNADPDRASRDVRALAQENLRSVRARIRRLRALETELTSLIASCPGDDTSDCAILDRLADAACGEDTAPKAV